jgi:hypothetical protein
LRVLSLPFSLPAFVFSNSLSFFSSFLSFCHFSSPLETYIPKTNDSSRLHQSP